MIFRGRKLSRRARNRQFGVVMQDVNHQLFSDSVKNECLSANPDATDQEIEDLLNSFELLDCTDRVIRLPFRADSGSGLPSVRQLWAKRSF